MKNTVQGDLLSVQKGIIVHGCNAQGYMGGGVAFAIKNKWPNVFEAYSDRHQRSGLKLGDVGFVPVDGFSQLIVANAITQEGFSGGVDTDYDAVRQCFRRVAIIASYTGLPVHYPKIGAGIGGGDWNVISKIIDEELAWVNHTLWVL